MPLHLSFFLLFSQIYISNNKAILSLFFYANINYAFLLKKTFIFITIFLLQVCTQLTYNDNGLPVQSMTTAQQIITMDKPVDEDNKVGGYDNTAANEFFNLHKIDDNSNDPTKYVITTLGSGMPSAVSLLIGKIPHVTQQSMNQLPTRPEEAWFESILENTNKFFSSMLGTQNRESRVQWLATSSEGHSLSNQHFHATNGLSWITGWAVDEAKTVDSSNGVPRKPYLITSIATTGSTTKSSMIEDEWIIIASDGVCAVSGVNNGEGCPQKIITGTTFPWKLWNENYNNGYRITSMAASNSTGWVLVLHQNSGIGKNLFVF